MITAMVYDTATGIASHSVSAATMDVLDLQANIGQAIYVGEFDPATQYLNPDNSYALVSRPVMNILQDKTQIVGDGVDTVTIHNILVGAEVVHPEGAFTSSESDNLATWACNTVGTYLFQFRLLPYQDAIVVVEVI